MDNIYNILKEIRPESDFENSSNYIEDYLLDSFDVLKLISELQRAYNIKFSPEDIISRNFCNMNKIATLLEKYGIAVQENE